MASQDRPATPPRLAPDETGWTIGMAGSGYNANTIYDPSQSAVADVYGIPLHTDLKHVEKDPRWAKGLATARLIRAAPEMLAVLREVDAELGRGHRDPNPESHCRLCRLRYSTQAVIAVAKNGEPHV